MQRAEEEKEEQEQEHDGVCDLDRQESGDGGFEYDFEDGGSSETCGEAEGGGGGGGRRVGDAVVRADGVGRARREAEEASSYRGVFCGVRDTPSECVAWVGVSPELCGVGGEVSLALGLHDKLPVFVQLSFGPKYNNSMGAPRVVSCVQGSPHDLSGASLQDQRDHGISWAMRTRMQAALRFLEWPPRADDMRAHERAARMLSVIADGATVEEARRALAACRGDSDAALLHLLSSERSARAGGATNVDDMLTLFPNNFLLQVAEAVRREVSSFSSRCMVCACEMQHTGLRPAICGSSVCAMGFEELGLGMGLGAEISKDPHVADLLISALFAAAAQGGRLELCAPSNLRSRSPASVAAAAAAAAAHTASRQGTTNDADIITPSRELVMETLNAIPPVASLCAAHADGSLRRVLDEAHPLAYALLRWMFSTTRCHLRSLRPEERMAGVDADHQFVMVSASADRERLFQRHKREGESQLGYHGSKIGNWHAIMRQGLKVMSRTAYMSSGAAYGDGCYLAEDMRTSLTYCGATSEASTWRHSRFGRSARIMALCEFVSGESDVTYSDALSGIYIVNNEEKLCTRFLLVNPRTAPRSKDLRAPDVMQFASRNVI